VLTGDHVGLVQEDCLPDAAQATKDETPGELTGGQALERDPEVIELSVAAHQTRGTRAGTERVRVLVWSIV
jgi:hypothetical protein